MRRLLPPALLLLVLALMCVAAAVLPLARWPAATVPGALLVVAGLAVAVVGRVQFARARTNVHTFREPEVLVTGGVFRLTRNPMYLGFALVAFGAAALSGALSPFVLAAGFVAISDRWYIRFEEEALRRAFGEPYERYAARTRRWL